MSSRIALALATAFVLAACGSPRPEPSPAVEPTPAPEPVEATSLLGEELRRPVIDDEFRDEQEQLLAEARAALEAAPDDADALIWTGRRTAYFGRYREAIEIYTRGIEQHPEDSRFYRHRGHRYITVRELDRAVADLTKSAELLAGKEPEVEPDGLPNARNTPTGTTHTSTWYHLGLAHYLRGDFASARDAYAECLRFSGNPDMVVASSYWLYMARRRLGEDEEAGRGLELISADMDIIEDHDYHHLLLLFRGEKTADELLGDDALAAATLGYGLGNWYLQNGAAERAFEIFEGIHAGGEWPAFGYIAAAAELSRR